MAEKKLSVGLLITFDLYGEKTAILQKRGEFNTETMSPETRQGGCQVTVHGGVHPGESAWEALDREIKEELGLEAFGWIKYSKHPTPLVVEFDSEEKFARTYTIHMINPDFLKYIQWHASSGGMKLVTASDVQNIADLSKIPKEGIVKCDVIAMFPDELEVLKKVLI